MSEAIRVVFISIPRDEAGPMARVLVEKRFAACVNIVPKIESYFWWDGAVEHDEESLLIAKTTEGRFEALMNHVEESHPYDFPEIISLPMAEGLPQYISWLVQEVSERDE